MPDRTFGWHKDPWRSTDYMHRTVRRDKLPDVCGSAAFLGPIRDQGNEGSCVGHGVGMAVVARLKQLGLYTEWDSVRYIYNGARFREGTLSNPQAGSNASDAYQWLVDKNVLMESKWVYVPMGPDATQDPNLHTKDAIAFPDFQYLRCADGVDGILSALADGRYVSIGCPWPERWMADPGAGILPDITVNDPLAGGHETCIYLGIQSEQCFYVANSWGTGWGKAGGIAGCYRMPFSALDTFKQLGGYDTQYPLFSATPVPVPVPPVPQKCCGLNGVRARKLWVNAGIPYKLEPKER